MTCAGVKRAKEIKKKSPTERRKWNFNFDKDIDDPLVTITAIETALVTGPTGATAVTILSSSFSGQRIQLHVSGGQSHTMYLAFVRGTTSDDQSVVAEGRLYVA